MFIDELSIDPEDRDLSHLANAVRELDREYRQFRRRAASAAGLSIAEFDALGALSWSTGVVTPKHLAEATNMTTGSVTALVDRLMALGIVDRRPSTNDRRSVELLLTSRGRQVVAAIYRSYLQAFRSLRSDYDSADVAALTTRLGDLRAVVSRAGEALDLEATSATAEQA